MAWGFSRGRGVFGDLVKYDIVGGRREKGCGEEGKKKRVMQ